MDEMKARLDDERERQQEGDSAKRKLWTIATQKLEAEHELLRALAEIQAMTPKQAIERLDMYLARADASL